MSGITLRGVLSDGSYQPDTTFTYVFGDLEQGNKAYVDDATGEPLATATLRVVTNRDLTRLRKRYLRSVPDGRGGFNEELSDPEAFKGDLLEFLIVDWMGLKGEDGQPLECTRRARLALDAASPDRTAHMLHVARKNEAVELAASFR